MKIVLTGAGGMFGRDVQRVFSDAEITPLTSHALDITVLDDVMGKIREVKPDFVIHAAAFTDVDRCETEPEKAYLVNGLGARNVTMACEETGCPVVYLSTDYVFDGSKNGPYDEWDDTRPVNRYGLSKLMGERYVASLTNRFYIVRTSWLFGRNGKNFVETILRLLSERESLEVVNDQIGCPTSTTDLATKLREVLGRGYGIYHITNTGSCSWYDFAVTIASKQGIKKRITSVSSERFKRPAKRPANSVLGNTMLRLEGIGPLRHWEEALDAYLGDR